MFKPGCHLRNLLHDYALLLGFIIVKLGFMAAIVKHWYMANYATSAARGNQALAYGLLYSVLQ